MKLLPSWIRLVRFNWSSFTLICFIYQYLDRCRSNLTLGLNRLFKDDARVIPGSRQRHGLMFPRVCVCRQIVASTFAPSWLGIGQVARPTISGISGRVTELRAVDEGAVPASTPMTSRLFVLPVAARRWVSTDNTLPHWNGHLHSHRFIMSRWLCCTGPTN
jgi:hypothetical protein